MRRLIKVFWGNGTTSSPRGDQDGGKKRGNKGDISGTKEDMVKDIKEPRYELAYRKSQAKKKDGRQSPNHKEQRQVPKYQQKIDLIQMVKDTIDVEALAQLDKIDQLKLTSTIQFGTLPTEAIINIAFIIPLFISSKARAVISVGWGLHQ